VAAVGVPAFFDCAAVAVACGMGMEIGLMALRLLALVPLPFGVASAAVLADDGSSDGLSVLAPLGTADAVTTAGCDGVEAVFEGFVAGAGVSCDAEIVAVGATTGCGCAAVGGAAGGGCNCAMLGVLDCAAVLGAAYCCGYAP